MSGGDYTYLRKSLGPLAGFLYIWMTVIVHGPMVLAIAALTFAQYCLQPLWPQCNPPVELIRLLAALVVCEYIFCFDGIQFLTKQDSHSFIVSIY